MKKLIATQFNDYVSGVRKADCAADLKRRLDKGPPIWLSDKHALPMPESDTHICRVWFATDGTEYSAKLANSVEVCGRVASSFGCVRPPRHRTASSTHRARCMSQGAERDALWEELKNFDPTGGSEGKAEGEEDANVAQATAEVAAAVVS